MGAAALVDEEAADRKRKIAAPWRRRARRAPYGSPVRADPPGVQKTVKF
jgi:hypothetical protein